MNLPSPLDCCDPACSSGGVAIPGPAGNPGNSGSSGTNGVDGKNCYSLLATSFTQPAVSANATTTVPDNGWVVVGENVFLQFIGTLLVFAKTGTTGLTLTNLGFPYSAVPGTVAPIGALIAPTGERGPTGSAGGAGNVGAKGDKGDKGDTGNTGAAGVDSFTTLTSNFAMPAVAGSGTAVVGNSTWMSIGQVIYIQNSGYLQVSAKPSSTQVTLVNLGYAGNVAPATVIASTSTLSPGGLIGPFIAQLQVTSSAVVSTTAAVIPLDDTIPQDTEGTQILSLAFTPTVNNSKIVIEVLVPCSVAGLDNVILSLFQSGGANAIAAIYQVQPVVNSPIQVALIFEIVSGSTTPRTYNVRIGTQSGSTITLNGSATARLLGGVMKYWMKVTEITP